MSDEPTTPLPPDPPPPPPSAGAPPPPPPVAPTAGGSDNRTLMIILAYLGPFALIPFLAEKDDQDIQWHAKHGLVLFGADIVISIILTIVSTVTACVGCLVTLPVWIIVAVVHIVCMVKGVNRERFLIPGLSDFADKF